MAALTNAMEISREVELAQLSLMVHVVRASEVIGEMEDPARKTYQLLAVLLFDTLHLKCTHYILTPQNHLKD